MERKNFGNESRKSDVLSLCMPTSRSLQVVKNEYFNDYSSYFRKVLEFLKLSQIVLQPFLRKCILRFGKSIYHTHINL